MTVASCHALAESSDRILAVHEHPDYPNALNGLQFANRSKITHIGAAVDLSLHTIRIAQAERVNFLIVHHGMFWGGLQRIVGGLHDRVRALIEADIAVYSAHLPLDSHPELGNAALLARRLGLEPSGGFARYLDRHVGVTGESDLSTVQLVETVTAFANEYHSMVRTTAVEPAQRTKRWAICTGAGASSDTLREAHVADIDTLIVGEGPHHTAVEAAELGVTVIYAGHYATETLGVQAIAQRISTDYGIPWRFLAAPTGL